jgi:hypothetical protein
MPTRLRTLIHLTDVFFFLLSQVHQHVNNTVYVRAAVLERVDQAARLTIIKKLPLLDHACGDESAQHWFTLRADRDRVRAAAIVSDRAISSWC